MHFRNGVRSRIASEKHSQALHSQVCFGEQMLRGKGMQGSSIRVFAGGIVPERHRVSRPTRIVPTYASSRFADRREARTSFLSLRNRKPAGSRCEAVYALPLFRFALRITS